MQAVVPYAALSLYRVRGPVNVEDLPPKLRAQALAQAGETPVRRSSRRTVAGGGQRWRCTVDGETFSALAPLERHMDSHGGGRYELILP